MSTDRKTGKSFNIGGVVIEQVESEPCYRVSQYMQNKPITCQCSKCKIDNAGLTNAQIIARMDKAYM